MSASRETCLLLAVMVITVVGYMVNYFVLSRWRWAKYVTRTCPGCRGRGYLGGGGEGYPPRVTCPKCQGKGSVKVLNKAALRKEARAAGESVAVDGVGTDPADAQAAWRERRPKMKKPMIP